MTDILTVMAEAYSKEEERLIFKYGRTDMSTDDICKRAMAAALRKAADMLSPMHYALADNLRFIAEQAP